MTSPLLALFTRSLREDTRSKATYWTRIGAGGLTLALLISFTLGDMWTGTPGLKFFIGIISLQAIGITFVGLSYFGSAITEEKEEQTLGLLRMTNLNPLSILLGKSTSRLCGALLLLASLFPFTVYAVTLGGVSLGQIVATYCTLGAYTFLLCNVALLGSVIFRKTSGAATFAVVVIGFLLVAGPLLRMLPFWMPKSRLVSELRPLAETLWTNSPIARLNEILQTRFSGAPAGSQVASNVILGTACFLLAWAVFGHFCDRTDEAGGAVKVSTRGSGIRSRRPPRPWVDALMWKDFFFLCGGNRGFAIRGVVYVGALLAGFYGWFLQTGPMGGYPWMMLFPLLSLGVSIDIANMAGRLFRSEISGQTLSALAILPSTIPQLARRKRRALLLAAIPSIFATTTAGLIQIYRYASSLNSQEFTLMITITVISGWAELILLVHAVAWFSLLMKRGALAVGFVATYALSILISVAASNVLDHFGMSLNQISGTLSMLLQSTVNSFVCIVASIFLHRSSLRRLEALAGED
jgi:hypothetical protein